MPTLLRLKIFGSYNPIFLPRGTSTGITKLHPRTREEIEVLETYGGEIIFTPGDIVYSSSELIESSPPNLAADKLATLLEAEGLDFADLRAALDKGQGIHVHVVGDTIIDSYTYCTLIGSNAKTPTFSVSRDAQTDFVGGAAVVAKHLRAAGARGHVFDCTRR